MFVSLCLTILAGRWKSEVLSVVLLTTLVQLTVEDYRLTCVLQLQWCPWAVILVVHPEVQSSVTQQEHLLQ